MAMVNWDESQRRAFLSMQFKAQLSHYQREYPRADHDIILHGDAPIGRLYVDQGESRIVLLDITLLPAWRNRGIGTHLLDDLMAAARDAGKPIHLHVWQQNEAAYRWYRRLGFIEVDRPHIYIRMVWRPD